MPAITPPDAHIDALIATALRGEMAAWPGDWPSEESQSAVVERALYQRVSGLLVEIGGQPSGWPDLVVGRIKVQALGQTMSELRHQRVLASLFTALADRNTTAALLKGTAIA